MIVLAGCNGAGKTTLSKRLLPKFLEVKEFVNADEIARGLSPYNPEGASFAAGRIMLERIRSLAVEQIDFAIETTLSTKTYASLFLELKERGYSIILIFVFLDSAEEAKTRVRKRVESGGHGISAEIVERRYKRGTENFKNIFMNLSDRFQVFDNTNALPIFVAEKDENGIIVYNQEIWNKIIDHE